MQEKKIEARFYAMESGREPVRAFLLDMEKGERKKVGEDIKACEIGWPIGLPVCSHLQDSIYEVRTPIKDRIVRVLFSVEKKFMVLYHAFIKKTKKTSPDDIEIASKRRKDFLKRL